MACDSEERTSQSMDQDAGSLSTLAAKVEPDLATTIRFIGNVSSLEQISIVHDDVAFETASPCVAVFNNRWARWQVDFSKLNPESIKIDNGAVQVRATNAESSIVRTHLGRNEPTNTLKFYVLSADDFSSVQEAFGHVILRCGGKGDPF